MHSQREEQQIALAEVMCSRCEARPGQRCVSVSGRPTHNMHAARYRPLLEAWRNGFAAGRAYPDE